MPQPAVKFREIIEALTAGGVRFVVIGGVALHLHGGDNLTLDIDISFARDRDNTDALAKLLASIRARPRNFPPELPFILDGQMLRNSTNVTMETTLGDFDLLAEPEGVDSFDGLWQRAIRMEIDEAVVRVASIDDLIAMKRAANRLKDQSHILALLALKRLSEADN